VKCWSCAAENDLGATQTCSVCGAPLARRGGFFRKPVLLGIAAGMVALWAAWFLWVLCFRACL
jgi:hypothetical protein